MSKGIKFYISKGLRKYLNPPAIRDSNIHGSVVVTNDCTISDSQVDRYTYISDHTLIASTVIGAFCSISSHCHIGSAGHPMDFVSTSPLFVDGHNAWDKHFSDHSFVPYQRTIIGNDVWIGTHCLIKSGVSIADGAIVGMGSVVTKNIGPYEIWAGNPAKFIRKRFDSEIIERLLEIKWWNYSDEDIKELAPYFNDPKRLLEVLDG